MEYQHTYVISTFSPIFPKGFKEFFHDIYIHKLVSPQIFPTGFLEEFFHIKIKQRLITRPQEEHIDYKTSRRTNWSRGSVMKKMVN